MAENPVPLAHFWARQIVDKHGPLGVGPNDLAESVAEIELQTQIQGASFIKVHLIDPQLAILKSGLIDQEEGVLTQVEVEFPEKSKWLWRLVAAEISTDFTQPNLVLTFEDKIVVELRERRGEKTAPAGTGVLQFIHSLVAEAKPRIQFVCPGLGKHLNNKEVSGSTVQPRAAENHAAATANKSKSTGKLCPDQFTFVGDLAATTKLDARVLAAWCLQEDNGSFAIGKENAHNNNWLNIGYFDSGPGQIAFTSGFKTPSGGADLTAKFLKGEWGGASAGIRAIIKSASGSPAQQIKAIQTSGWATSGEPALPGLYNEINPSEVPSGGESEPGSGTKTPSSSGTAAEATGQLSRGSTEHPSEDSWECITRLARAKGWFFFTNGKTAFLMDGPQMIHQKPVCHANISLNRINRPEHSGGLIHESDVIQTPTTGTIDNTTLEYQSTHKVHGKVSHKSKTSKPSTPAEVRLNMACEITTFRAGDVFVIQGLGPFDGPWIVSDATRNCLKDNFTQFILQPPLEPIQQKEAGATSFAGTQGGAAAQAEKALSEKSKYQYSEGSDRGNNGTLFGPTPRTMDCSSFATLCYKEAKLPDPSEQNYNPIGFTGSMIPHCTKVATPSPGDLCFFGSSVSATTHVTVYIGGGEAISMGKPGDPEKGPAASTGPSGFLGYYRPNSLK